MSVATVAGKEFADARRSRALWALSGLFVLLTLLLVWTYTVVVEAGDAELTGLGLLGFVGSSVSLFVSIAALVVCYKAVAGETESGSGKLLLSLPHSRRDVVLGKVAGRGLTLAVPVVVGLVVALVAAATLEVSLTAAAYEVAGLSLPGWPVVYAAFAAITLLYALAYVALVVGISASTSSTSRAAALAVGAWVTLEVLWDVVPLGAVYVVDGFRLPANPAVLPDWATLLGLLSPGRAYLQATSGLTTETAQSGPAVLDPWVSVVVLAAWVVVPVALGYLRYRRADL